MIALKSVTPALPYYKVHQVKQSWQIARTLNEHILCICRNQVEAIRLTGVLNDFALLSR